MKRWAGSSLRGSAGSVRPFSRRLPFLPFFMIFIALPLLTGRLVQPLKAYLIFGFRCAFRRRLGGAVRAVEHPAQLGEAVPGQRELAGEVVGVQVLEFVCQHAGGVRSHDDMVGPAATFDAAANR